VTDAGQAALLFGVPVVYFPMVGLGAAITVWLAQTRLGWMAAGLTAAVALPRFFVYDITFLAPPDSKRADNRRDVGSEV
jgi:hypothetical protein